MRVSFDYDASSPCLEAGEIGGSGWSSPDGETGGLTGGGTTSSCSASGSPCASSSGSGSCSVSATAAILGGSAAGGAGGCGPRERLASAEALAAPTIASETSPIAS